jgi:hypothetical protein
MGLLLCLPLLFWLILLHLLLPLCLQLLFLEAALRLLMTSLLLSLWVPLLLLLVSWWQVTEDFDSDEEIRWAGNADRQVLVVIFLFRVIYPHFPSPILFLRSR